MRRLSLRLVACLLGGLAPALAGQQTTDAPPRFADLAWRTGAADVVGALHVAGFEDAGATGTGGILFRGTLLDEAVRLGAFFDDGGRLYEVSFMFTGPGDANAVALRVVEQLRTRYGRETLYRRGTTDEPFLFAWVYRRQDQVAPTEATLWAYDHVRVLYRVADDAIAVTYAAALAGPPGGQLPGTTKDNGARLF